VNLPSSKIFIYTRRSQDRSDRQMLSIDGQLSELRELISKEEFIPIELPPEERSAHYPGRPIFNDMMERFEARECIYIVVWNTNRLARNPVDGGRVIWALEKGQLLGIITPHKRYGATSNDMFLLHLEFGMSKKSSDDIRTGVLRGYKTKYERGEYPGAGPIGYINGKIDRFYKNILPDPEKADKVISLFNLAATGTYTLDDIWKYSHKLIFEVGMIIYYRSLQSMICCGAKHIPALSFMEELGESGHISL
jgi:site-specific DNA recombinase